MVAVSFTHAEAATEAQDMTEAFLRKAIYMVNNSGGPFSPGNRERIIGACVVSMAHLYTAALDRNRS
jgi:hypothetical protein